QHLALERLQVAIEATPDDVWPCLSVASIRPCDEHVAVRKTNDIWVVLSPKRAFVRVGAELDLSADRVEAPQSNAESRPVHLQIVERQGKTAVGEGGQHWVRRRARGSSGIDVPFPISPSIQKLYADAVDFDAFGDSDRQDIGGRC